jgi:predicted hotdog family 3-hydroxylacyl-ACP dehydratase
MPLDRRWIEQHIPHKGRMCLLDEVLSWDAARIRCRSVTHRAPDNPLRAHERLGAACGIEYAAQAMAVHGALVAASAPLASTVSTSMRGTIGAAVGYLASVRNVALYVRRLDDLGPDLIATAERVTGDARTVLYEFAVWAAERPLLSGRASIVFDAAFGLPEAGTGTAP